jgi:hypothetical protein
VGETADGLPEFPPHGCSPGSEAKKVWLALKLKVSFPPGRWRKVFFPDGRLPAKSYNVVCPSASVKMVVMP